jgi:hypothetical protein
LEIIQSPIKTNRRAIKTNRKRGGKTIKILKHKNVKMGESK